MKEIIVSGMRSTGKLHLGHYLGVIQNWVQLQDKYDCYFFVADWHALTTKYDKTEKKSKIGYDYLLSENIEILTNNFEAYRTDYSIDILIERGEIVFLLNGVKRIVNSLSFVIVQAGDELHFISFSDDVKLCFNIISPEIRYSLLEKFEENSIFQQINALNSVFSLEESNFDIYQNNISEVKSLLSNKDNTNKLQQLTHLLICHHYKLAHKHHPSISNNDSILFNSSSYSALRASLFFLASSSIFFINSFVSIAIFLSY